MMWRGKTLTCSVGLLLFVIFFTLDLLQQSCATEACAPFSCGKISNISYPFRLKDDPENCGDPSYELDCENNVTLTWPLFDSRKYKVLAINYNNFTVRVVDAGLQEGDCSSFPRYSLSASFFRNYEQYVVGPYPYEPSWPVDNVGEITYLNCSNAVTDDLRYMNTSPCVNWHSKGHFYAIAGDSITVADLKSQCEVKLVTAMTWHRSWDYKTFTYAEIHKIAVYGFEVSWVNVACLQHCGDWDCYFNQTTHILQCYSDLYPFGFDPIKCGIMSKWCTLARDCGVAILIGISRLRYGGPTFIRANSKRNSTFYRLSVLAVDVGIVTGEFVLPSITARFLLGIGFLFVLLIYTCRRRHTSMYENIEDFLQENNLMPIRYSYRDIKKMTRGFKEKLGEGGYGCVYKGKLRSGPFVAVKLLGKSKANGQEFISEVATIGRIHHANVVTLIGYCVEGLKRALVYEFMPNDSLDKYIFFNENSISLSNEKIFEISLGVARGIAYLHQGCDMQILHFDIKPYNILLDDNFIPKVSDFGLAKLYPIDDSIVTLTAARGTLGYMAPELFYNNIGGVSYKADVYSFGMLLMEMASKRKNLNPHDEHSSQLYFPFWIHDQFSE